MTSYTKNFKKDFDQTLIKVEKIKDLKSRTIEVTLGITNLYIEDV